MNKTNTSGGVTGFFPQLWKSTKTFIKREKQKLWDSVRIVVTEHIIPSFSYMNKPQKTNRSVTQLTDEKLNKLY